MPSSNTTRLAHHQVWEIVLKSFGCITKIKQDDGSAASAPALVAMATLALQIGPHMG